MYSILTYNNISPKGLNRFPSNLYQVSDQADSPNAIILRSYNLHEETFSPGLLAVGRAGAGVNNVPVGKLSEMGIPVFNTPGANANAVKELVVAGMLIACRNICHAWRYVTGLEGSTEELGKAVEAGKKQYAGFELPGRTLGVIGLGAIGRSVANAAEALGMQVIGFDPGLTVEGAWQLSSQIRRARNIDEVFRVADFLTVHVPLNDATKHLISADRLKQMKDNVVILNFARHGIVDDEAMQAAIESKKVYAYVCDFPSKVFQGNDRVIALPHLGASTGEAEENCAVMVADQIRDYIENGNIRNSVNFPEANMARATDYRLSVVNANVPNMLGQISTAVAESNLNIHEMVNMSRGNLAYTLVDLDSPIPDEVKNKISAIKGVLAVRIIDAPVNTD